MFGALYMYISGHTKDHQLCLFLVQVEYNRQTSWLHPPIGNLWIWTLGCGSVYYRWSEIFCRSVIYPFYIASHQPSSDLCHLFEWTWSRKGSSVTGKETLKELQRANLLELYRTSRHIRSRSPANFQSPDCLKLDIFHFPLWKIDFFLKIKKRFKKK